MSAYMYVMYMCMCIMQAMQVVNPRQLALLPRQVAFSPKQLGSVLSPGSPFQQFSPPKEGKICCKTPG